MATINFDVFPFEGGTLQLKAALSTGDTTDAHVAPGSTSLLGSLQATGTWDGATLAVCESNDGTNWFTAKQPDGTTDALLTADGIVQFSSAAKFIMVSGPDGGDLGGTTASLAINAFLRG